MILINNMNTANIISIIAIIVTVGLAVITGFIILLVKLSKIEEKTNRIPGIEDKISILEIKFSSLISVLTAKKIIGPGEIFNSKSPLELTKLGEDILNITGGKKYVDDHLDYLIDKIKQEDLKSPLDIQNYTEILLFKEENSDNFIAIKNYIYNNPKFKDTIVDIALVINVMRIYLRDKYFEKNPELIIV